MEDDFELKFHPDKKEEEEANIFNGQAKVNFGATALYELEKFARQDLKNEQGAILLGDWRKEEGQIIVDVMEWIEAKYTDKQATNVTFTHKTWDYIHQQQEEKYPDLKIIGWYHTHPSFGVFLSSYDKFIQENFFNQEWQIAVVTDPIKNKTGVFVWSEGKITPSGFNIVDRKSSTQKPTLVTDDKNKREFVTNSSEDKIKPKIFIIFVSLIMFSLGFSIQPLITYRFNSEPNSQTLIIEENDLKEIPNPDSEKKEEKEEFWISIIVQSGDTISRLIRQHNISKDRLSDILERNNIKNADYIFIGDRIELPLD